MLFDFDTFDLSLELRLPLPKAMNPAPATAEATDWSAVRLFIGTFIHCCCFRKRVPRDIAAFELFPCTGFR
jgi:hypothetical protein